MFGKLIFSTLITFTLVSYAQLGSLEQLQKQAASMLSGASGAGRDLEASEYLIGKFKFDPDGKPSWYPEFYPITDEMVPGNDFKPRISLLKRNSGTNILLAPVIEIFQKKNSAGACEPISPLLSFNASLGDPYCLEDAKRYTVDSTRLASLEESPQSGQYQSALVSVFNMDVLTDLQKSQLMTDPHVSIQTIIDNAPTSSDKQALFDPRRVRFLKYNADPSNSLALKSVTALVGGIQVDIPVELPPEPNCRVQIANGQSEPFDPGQTVRFDLLVDSVTLNAKKINGMQDEEDIELNIIPRFPAQAFGSSPPSHKLTEFRLTLPSDFSAEPHPDHPTETGWKVAAQVRGLGGAYQYCELDRPARIRRPPPPDCNLVASSQEAEPGSSVTLILSKRSPSLVVTEAFIGDQNVSSQIANQGTANQSYIRSSNSSETVIARLIGPGGQRTCSVTLNTQVPACPWEQYNYWAVPEMCSRSCFRGVCGTSCRDFGGRKYGRTLKSFPNGYTTEEGHNGAGSQINCGPGRLCLVNYVTTNWHHYTAISIGDLGSENCSVKQIKIRDAGCFTPDTQIKMANGSLKLASDIHENDYVFNPHYRTGIRVRKVVKGPEKKSLYEVKTSEGKVEVTEDHPFLTGRGWVQAMSLKKGDKLLGNGKPKAVGQVKKLKYQGPQDVWNFELDSEDPMAHVVIANGIPTGDLVTQLELKKPKAKLP